MCVVPPGPSFFQNQNICSSVISVKRDNLVIRFCSMMWVNQIFIKLVKFYENFFPHLITSPRPTSLFFIFYVNYLQLFFSFISSMLFSTFSVYLFRDESFSSCRSFRFCFISNIDWKLDKKDQPKRTQRAVNQRVVCFNLAWWPHILIGVWYRVIIFRVNKGEKKNILF